LDRRLGEPQSLSGRGGEDRNSQLLLLLELDPCTLFYNISSYLLLYLAAFTNTTLKLINKDGKYGII
jgi:hypothetical protein